MMTVLYTCPFVPAEWIEAHGLRARRITPAAVVKRGLPQTGVCSYARSFAAWALDASDDTAVVFSTRCDQMRRIHDLVSGQRRGPTFLLNVPATVRTNAAERLYLAELVRLGGFLQRLGGRSPEPERLRRCVLESRRTESSLAPFTSEVPSEGHHGSVRLAVTGGPLPEPSAFLGQVARAGGSLVLDATDSGERVQPGPCDPERLTEEPLVELARSYLSIPSVHQRPNTRLFAWLRRRMAALRVQGLVLRRYVWCDLWHAEARRLADELGMPLLDLEIDEDGQEADVRTASRIEAFVEVAGGR